MHYASPLIYSKIICVDSRRVPSPKQEPHFVCSTESLFENTPERSRIKSQPSRDKTPSARNESHSANYVSYSNDKPSLFGDRNPLTCTTTNSNNVKSTPVDKSGAVVISSKYNDTSPRIDAGQSIYFTSRSNTIRRSTSTNSISVISGTPINSKIEISNQKHKVDEISMSDMPFSIIDDANNNDSLKLGKTSKANKMCCDPSKTHGSTDFIVTPCSPTNDRVVISDAILSIRGNNSKISSESIQKVEKDKIDYKSISEIIVNKDKDATIVKDISPIKRKLKTKQIRKMNIIKSSETKSSGRTTVLG